MPHTKLSVVHALMEAGSVRSTVSALTGASALGFDFEGIVQVVMSLTAADFYKSMTTQADHRIWQDVYRPETASGEIIYLKITVIDDVLIVSFKEL